MERTTRPARSEFRLLPWMIAKAVGEIAAALGSLTAVWTRTQALVGFLIFIGTGRALAKLADGAQPDVPARGRPLPGEQVGAYNRPEAATDLHDHLNWSFHWSAREESHDRGPCVLAMLNDPVVA